MLIATVDGGRNCGKTKKIQDILAEEVKRGKRCLYLSRHDQKMLRGAGHPAIDMLTYIFAREEERGYESMHGMPDYVSDILKQIKP